MLHGLIIGVDTYADARIPALRSARADAEALSDILQNRISPNERVITTLLDHQATKTAIMRALGETLPRRHGKEDLIFIFFAGHGSPEQVNPPDRISRYLIATDTEYDQIFATGISLDRDIAALLDRQVSFRVLMAIDACFSGRAGGRTFMGPCLAERSATFRAPLSLSNLDLGFGRAIISACRDDELAAENAAHGVFTEFLLDALQSASADKTISVAEIYEFVYRGVTRATCHAQHPVLAGRLEGLRFPRLRHA